MSQDSSRLRCQQIAQELRALSTFNFEPVQIARTAVAYIREAIDLGVLSANPHLRALAKTKRPCQAEKQDNLSYESSSNNPATIDDDVYAWDKIVDYLSNDEWREARKSKLGLLQSWLEACEDVARMLEDATSYTPSDGPWSKPDGPAQWAKRFGVHVSTITRRFNKQIIRSSASEFKIWF